jgi:hypothetical protein
MATTKNLVIDQGATFSANIQFLDTSKNPISLAGYSVRSKMRTSYDTANAAILTANVVNATTGNVNLFLDSANTSLLPQGRYVYDVEAYAGNTVVRIVEGSITVMPGVSGNSTGSILKQTINSLVNGSYTVALAANGTVTVPGIITIPGGAQIINYNGGGIDIKAGANAWAELMSNDGNTYIWVDNSGAYIGTNWNSGGKQWTFGNDGVLTLPSSSSQIGRSGYTNGIDLYNNNGGTGYVRMNYADESVIWADSDGVHVQTAGANTWDFNAGGYLRFPDGNVQTTAFVSNNYISKATLKAIVANSATYAAFQANIAAL